jgi:nucleoside-diphosphate-sugar epimerase
VKALRRETSKLDSCKKIFRYYNLESLYNNINWCIGDINDVALLEEQMAECDVIIHAAALVSFHKKDIDNLKKTNIEGTANVMNIALSLNYQKCIYISSVATLGREIESNQVDESCIFKFNNEESNYSYSKYYAEQEVWRASNEGLDVVILNPSIILGPGNWDKGSSKIFQRIYQGLKFYTTGSSGYVDVIDIANITLLFLRNNIVNERFVLNGTNISYRDAFDLIADELGVKRATIKVTPLLKELAWRFERIRSFIINRPSLLTKETAASSMRNISYSSEKIKILLDYDFISFEDSIKKYGKLFKQDLI